MHQFLIGIDEAGRGPLAGPVSVGAVIVPKGFDVRCEFPGVKDSKLLSSGQREEIYSEVIRREEKGDIKFCVRFSAHSYIDECGITQAVHRAVASGVHALAHRPQGVRVFLDGLLHAPREYEQETIIHGDALVPIISLASVIAKVRRDRLMRRFARSFPQYGFEQHKGYPTRQHCAAIARFGICAIHRLTYCTRFLAGSIK